ncbi:MAG TPA: HAMP domain-containing sensor histidine kinase, partial [Vicinamibacterales bacterium]|nr:HAMP domain-containing sensor histidine kinase [Vicinamibacterales bacterium]
NRLVLGGVEGFLADAEHLRQHYFPELLSGGAANAARDPAFPALAVSIFDDGGQEISRSGRSLLDKYDAQTSFPFLFFEPGLFDSLSPYHPQVHEWTVRTGFQSGDIQAIARQQTAPQRWAWLLASLVTAVGIGLTAISAVRQIRLSAMKSDFVASVSHDLRTPLTKIQLYADSLASARSKSQEKFDAYCRVISLQAKRLTQLIQELLDFSRIEAGVREYEMNELDLRDVLQDTLDMFDQEIGQDDRTTEIVLPDVPVPVLGSAEGLQQLFGNLISNALKYSPGEQYLRVALATGNGHATVKVTDRGIGVPRREHRQIFKKFYRSASAASTATGSGIGLAIVDHVARAHGGTVTVASDSGCGTTFTVTLPVVAESREVWW